MDPRLRGDDSGGYASSRAQSGSADPRPRTPPQKTPGPNPPSRQVGSRGMPRLSPGQLVGGAYIADEDDDIIEDSIESDEVRQPFICSCSIDDEALSIDDEGCR